jgi:hypothetical protein
LINAQELDPLPERQNELGFAVCSGRV